MFAPDLFFEPLELRGQFANLGIQFVNAFFVIGAELRIALALWLEERRQLFQGMGFPVIDLGWVNLFVRSNLIDCLVFFEDLDHGFGFEIG